MQLRWAGSTCLCATLTILLLALQEPASADTMISTIIVPGEALGPAKIGMSVAELTAVLGPSVPEAGGRLGFPRWAVTVTLQDGVAVRLSTTHPGFRTRRGAGVGTRLGEAARLIGDLNQMETVMGGDTTVMFPFQGVGFVFRAGQAVEVFVLERIALSPPAPLARAVQPSSQAPATQEPGTEEKGATAAIEGLAEAVDATDGFFQVTGRVVNTGSRPLESVTVTATLERFSGDDSRKQFVLQRPLAPGAGAPFSVGTYVRSALVARYTVEIAGGTPGRESTLARETRIVPPAVYAELARRMIVITLAQGPPSNTVRALAIQVLVSISGTGSIPPAWIKDVRVEISHNFPAGFQAGFQEIRFITTGSQEIHLAPGQVRTILVPSTRMTVIAGQPVPLAPGQPEPLFAKATVQEILLGTP